MTPERKEIIKLTTKELLLSFFDGWASIETIFGYPWQRAEAYKYLRERVKNKDSYYTKLWKLEKQGYIKRYKKEKESIITLTTFGKNKAKYYLAEKITIPVPEKWDKKWRIVAFDIPNNKKTARNILANKLKKLGFIRLQKSIFVFPYDCKKEVDYLKEIYQIKPYVQCILADQIDSEADLLNYFLNKGILRKEY